MVPRALIGGLALTLSVSACGSASEGAQPEQARAEGVALGSNWFRPQVYCPPGTHFEGSVCKALVVLDCPPGTMFEDEVGCVPLVRTAAPSATEPVPPPFELNPPPTTAPMARCGCPPNDLMCAMQCAQGKQAPQAGAAPFDRSAASSALSTAAAGAQACKLSGGPAGPGKVRLTFVNNGTAQGASVDEPFKGTPTGNCIEGVFRATRVPVFSGPPVTVSKTFTLR